MLKMLHNYIPTTPPAYIDGTDICTKCGMLRDIWGNSMFGSKYRYWESLNAWINCNPHCVDIEYNCDELILKSIL